MCVYKVAFHNLERPRSAVVGVSVAKQLEAMGGWERLGYFFKTLLAVHHVGTRKIKIEISLGI